MKTLSTNAKFRHACAAVFFAVFLGAPMAANSQSGNYLCPGGPGPGERQVGMTPGGAIAPVPVCTRVDSGPAYGGRPAPLRPAEPPPDAYVAVAWHADAADVWAVWNERSDAVAKRIVLEACNRVMGGGCTIAQAGRNSAVAIARGDDGVLHSAWGATPEEARAQMLDYCAKKSLKCEVAHLFNAIPPRNDSILAQFGQVFNPNRNYLPDKAVARTARGQQVQSVKLRALLTGANICLDVVNDGQNNRVIMAVCGNTTGQAWNLERTGDEKYKLRTALTGANRCLDIINDGANDKLQMAECGNYSGQMWRMARSEREEYVRLSTDFTGANKCLDIADDGRSNQLRMADCGDSTGQQWIVK